MMPAARGQRSDKLVDIRRALGEHDQGVRTAASVVELVRGIIKAPTDDPPAPGDLQVRIALAKSLLAPITADVARASQAFRALDGATVDQLLTESR